MQHRQRRARQGGRQRDHGADVTLLGRHIDVARLVGAVGCLMDDRSGPDIARRDGTADMKCRDHRKGKGTENPEQG